VSLPDLSDPDLLHVAVFGQGHGEAIVVHAPPDQWLVVDSVASGPRDRRTNPVTLLLTQHAARWTAAVLTHTHRDHAGAFEDYLVPDVGSGPVGCSLVPPTPGDGTDNRRSTFGSTKTARKVERLIRERWDDDSESEWNLSTALKPQSLGELTIIPRWPGFVPRRDPRDLNSLSTPLELHWYDASVLLAGDLLNDGWDALKGHGWTGVLLDPLKVAHHASLGAQHDVVLAGVKTRTAVCAPLAGYPLPDFDGGGGAAAVLEHVEELRLSAFPWAALADPATRSEAADAQRARAGARIRGRYTSVDRPIIDVRDAWQHVKICPDGLVASVTAGPAGRTIVR
jgi:hypothetical protein